MYAAKYSEQDREESFRRLEMLLEEEDKNSGNSVKSSFQNGWIVLCWPVLVVFNFVFFQV